MSIFRDGLLRGEVALVTGGGTGIGKEIARALGRHGARVAIASRKSEVVEATCKELQADGIECMTGCCDIRRSEEVEQVVAQILERWGRLDVLVNNAAGNFPAPMSGISYNGFKAIVDIDLLGTYNVSKAVFEARMREHGGRIVNISAPFDGYGVAFQAHVAAAKTGVESLTRTCAVEWGPLGIRVNAVGPGEIDATEGLDRFESEVRVAEGSNPLGRKGTKQDIADAVLFLVSEAASFVSGQVLYVDGAASVDMIKMKVV